MDMLEEQKDSKYLLMKNVPDLIIFTIFNFYHLEEQFNKKLCGKGITIYNHGMMVNNNNQEEYTFNTVYGTKIIASTIKKTYIWIFKNLGGATDGLVIGIDNADGKWVNSGFHKKKEKACYAYGINQILIQDFQDLNIEMIF
eukprot:117517_1